MPTFEMPAFTFWKLVFTAIGAAVFWAKWGRSRLRAYVLSDFVALLPLSRRGRAAVELLIFLALGSIVGIGVANPLNVTQAITAGFGWTGIVTKLPGTPRKPKKDK